MSKAEESLLIEAQRFQDWAKAALPDPEARFGEWECDYPDWPRAYEAVEAILSSDEAWSKAATEALLRLLDADNECAIIAYELGKSPVKLLRLSRIAQQSTPWPNARWQLAVQLGDLESKHEEAEELLLAFAHDEDEYTRRRALRALAGMNSPHVAALIEPAWRSGHQYQRMMALFALWKTHSPELPKYLQMAEEDGREYLLAYATKVRAGKAE